MVDAVGAILVILILTTKAKIKPFYRIINAPENAVTQMLESLILNEWH
jgi:H+/gluconate symporter-like permease